MYIIITPPVWEYLLVSHDGRVQLYYPGQEVKCQPGEALKIVDVKSNIISDLNFALLMADGRLIMLSDNVLDTSNEALQQAWSQGQMVRLAWLRPEPNWQVVGQLTLSTKEN